MAHAYQRDLIRALINRVRLSLNRVQNYEIEYRGVSGTRTTQYVNATVD